MFAQLGSIVQRSQLSAQFAKLENIRARRQKRASNAKRGRIPAMPLLHVRIAYLVGSVLQAQHIALHVLLESSAGTQIPSASLVESDDILLRALRSASNVRS
jgi:hypothetical protein